MIKFQNKLKLPDKIIKNLVERMCVSNMENNVVDKNTVCLEWVGRYDEYKRPIFSIKGKYRLTKHVVYESWYEMIDADMTVINNCRNKNCVRPDHLKMSFYFYPTTYARNGKKDPKNRRKKLMVTVSEKLMLLVFNGIKYGRLKSIPEIGRFMNVEDSDVIEYICNNNWMYINNIYTKNQLDELRAKVMSKLEFDLNYFSMRKFCDEFFNNRGCSST